MVGFEWKYILKFTNKSTYNLRSKILMQKIQKPRHIYRHIFYCIVNIEKSFIFFLDIPFTTFFLRILFNQTEWKTWLATLRGLLYGLKQIGKQQQ